MHPQAICQDIVIHLLFLEGFPQFAGRFLIACFFQPLRQLHNLRAQLPHLTGRHFADKIQGSSPSPLTRLPHSSLVHGIRLYFSHQGSRL